MPREETSMVMGYIPITPQDAIFNHPSCGKFENVLQSKKLEILQVFLRFFSIRTFQLLAIWMLKSRILRCNGYIQNRICSSTLQNARVGFLFVNKECDGGAGKTWFGSMSPGGHRGWEKCSWCLGN